MSHIDTSDMSLRLFWNAWVPALVPDFQGGAFPILILLDVCGRFFVYFTYNCKLKIGGIYMKVQPLADRVLVKQEKSEAKTSSGIIIPDTAQEKTQTGVVKAVGPGTEKEKITVSVGQKVMYDKYSGTQIKIDGEDHLILKNQDIVAVIE
jgi:chaperonin GroES